MSRDRVVMRRKSVRMLERERVYEEVRRRYLSENPVCERCNKASSTQIHHKRGRCGKRLIDPTWYLAVCTRCHRELHDRPAEAREAGYMLNRDEVIR
jgi:ribosomal protein S21